MTVTDTACGVSSGAQGRREQWGGWEDPPGSQEDTVSLQDLVWERQKGKDLRKREEFAMGKACRLHPSGKCPVHILYQDGEDRKLSCECQHGAHRHDLLVDLSVKLQPAH